MNFWMTRHSIAVLVAFVAASSSACHPSADLGSANERIKLESNVKVVATCGEQIPPEHRIASTANLLIGAARGSSICLDESDAITFKPGHARLRVFRDGGASIELQCLDDSTHDAFYRRREGERVVLLAGGAVIGIFSATTPLRESRCGSIDTSTFEEAVALCETFATAWGTSIDECLELCDDSRAVCVQAP